MEIRGHRVAHVISKSDCTGQNSLNVPEGEYLEKMSVGSSFWNNYSNE